MKKSGFVRYLAYFTLILIFLNTLASGALAAENVSERGYTNQDLYEEGDTAKYKLENINDISKNDADINNTNTNEKDYSGPNSKEPRNNERIEENNKILEHREFRKEIKEELQVQREEYRKAKEDFLKIRNKIQTGELNPNSDEALEGTKVYLNSTINYMIFHLSSVKKNLEYSNSDKIKEEIAVIDEKISLLEAEKTKVAKASNQKELAARVRALQETWNNAQKASLAGAGKIVSQKIGEFFEKSENLSANIELKIESLRGNGIDTSDLEVKLESYNAYINSAKEKKEAADVIYADTDTTHEVMKKANNYLREALKDINKANKILKEIFDKLKEHEAENV
ncbi:MAG: chromosome segregation ATPase [Methanosarcina sp.]